MIEYEIFDGRCYRFTELDLEEALTSIKQLDRPKIIEVSKGVRRQIW